MAISYSGLFSYKGKTWSGPECDFTQNPLVSSLVLLFKTVKLGFSQRWSMPRV